MGRSGKLRCGGEQPDTSLAGLPPPVCRRGLPHTLSHSQDAQQNQL